MYRFGKNSTQRLDTCCELLYDIMSESLACSPLDFGIDCGARSIFEQNDLYAKGKSKIQVKTGEDFARAKHVIGCLQNHPLLTSFERQYSLAVDISVHVTLKPELRYDYNHLCFLAGHILAVSRDVIIEFGYDPKKVYLRWGGNWDGDGEIITDQKFNDLVHFELCGME